MLQTNSQIELAGEFLRNTGVNIFLTGRAGTGKTTFLRTIIETLNKRVVVAAPTGVAAVNARGVTLHSLFQLPFGPNVPRSEEQATKDWAYRKMSRRKLSLIRSIELLVIDEISMVRCDLLDAVDETLRRVRRTNVPFGGVQLLMIGDIQQLSPICHEDDWQLLSPHYSSPYFFDSHALRGCDYITIELKQIFRQSDKEFTSLLNAVRDNAITREVIDRLNSRYIPNFEPRDDEGYITLTTHNNTANSINTNALARLKTKQATYSATVSGDYPEWAYPNDKELSLKVGAQVIFIKNDGSGDKLYYNGMIGKVTELSDNTVKVAPNSGEAPILLSAVEWENIEYQTTTDGAIEEIVKGRYSQIPLKCAWAITIHKSQGLSFDRAIIDASSSFAHGQVYVALSRCRSFEGLVLRSPLGQGSIINDSTVKGFNDQMSANEPTSEDLERYKRDYFISSLSEIFNFDNFNRLTYTLSKLINTNLYREYPKLCDCFNELVQASNNDMQQIGNTFCSQLRKLATQSANYPTDSFIKERITKGADYFTERITPFKILISECSTIKAGAKEIEKRLKRLNEEMAEELAIKECALALCAEDFTCEEYLKRKYQILGSPTAKDIKSTKAKSTLKISEEIINEELYDTLVAWRLDKAREAGTPAFTILTNKTIVGIQASLPTTIEALSIVSGIGEQKIRTYGDEIIEIVQGFTLSSGIDIEAYREQKIGFEEHIIEPKPKKERKPKEIKEPKEESYITTLKLYNEGLSADEIATQRQVTRQTIMNHLARNIELGSIPIEDLVEYKCLEKVSAILDKGVTRLGEIREALGDSVSYEEIKLVIAHYKFKNNL